MDRNNQEYPSKSSSSTNIKNHDMLALKEYITAQDHSNPYSDGRLQLNTLLIDLTHSNLQQRHIEQRFDRHDTIAHVKQRIYLKTGTPPPFQRLQLKCGGQLVQEIPAAADDLPVVNNMDHYKLGYFFGTYSGSNLTIDDFDDHVDDDNQHQIWPLLSQLQIHCTDINPHSVSRGGQLEDTTLIPKYRMSEEDYEKRPGTLRDWSRKQQAQDATFTLRKHAQYHREWCEAQRQHRLGLPLPRGFVLDSTGKVIRDDDPLIENDDDDNHHHQHHQERTQNEKNTQPKQDLVESSLEEYYGESSVAHVITAIGQRCQVEPGQRRGKISYVGKVPELDTKTSKSSNRNNSSYWVGVTFDEPVGKSNGTVGSTQYFDTLPRYGGFVRGKNVQVGDFPERDDIFDDDDDEDEL